MNAMSSAILAIETSTGVARVVVVDARQGARLAGAEAVAERHSSNLLRLCSEAAEAAGVSIAGLAAIACGAGPGSFTGLRVGLAVAKGLAMPTNIPLVLVSSLETLALDMLHMQSSAGEGELLVPCLDAGKGQIYAALFRPHARAAAETPALEKLGGDWTVSPGLLAEEIADGSAIVIAGPGAVRYREALAVGFGGRARFMEVAGPSADSVAAQALARLARGDLDDLASAVPAYGRAPDITKPKKPPG